MSKEILIKSKKRVQKHGEVFTPSWMVEKMLDVDDIKKCCENLTATFLEPSVGEGAFLTAILRRKLNMVAEMYSADINQFESFSLYALSTLYGIELLDDNVQMCVMNLYQEYYECYFTIAQKFNIKLKKKVLNYLGQQDEIWVRDAYACASPEHRINIRVINENPWSNLFAYNMFLRPTEKELENFTPEWHIIQAPGFKADPAVDGTRQHNFAVVSFTHKTILIGGTGYTGEMKKGIFTILNYILPQQKNVLSMHCSANMGQEGDVAVFFGLSGTGKTTLSADPNRKLIGDDEHGWTNNSVFNFEGGCYAKTIDLSKENEPDIFNAIKRDALLENVTVDANGKIDFKDGSVTQNTRVSYPINHIQNIVKPVSKALQSLYLF